MQKLKLILRRISNPWKVFDSLCSRGLLRWISDELMLKILYREHIKKKLDLENPQTYTAKLQWIKLNVQNDYYTQLIDKNLVKPIVASMIGEEYVIPTLGVYKNFDEIQFNKLPNEFVLKCNHDSGGLIIVKNKSTLDIKATRKKIETCLKKNYYSIYREKLYETISPCIIAEKYMEDAETKELRDYKFFCFDGIPRFMFIAGDRMSKEKDTTFDFFDMDYNHLSVKNGHPNALSIPPRPSQFNLMKELAAKLSQGIPHVRVDLYEINGKVYFGEMTFTHNSGLVPFEPEEWDYKFGEFLKLPK